MHFTLIFFYMTCIKFLSIHLIYTSVNNILFFSPVTSRTGNAFMILLKQMDKIKKKRN